MKDSNTNQKKYIVGITFKNKSKSYDYDANSLNFRVGDMCIAETHWGEDIGMIAATKRTLCCNKMRKQYKKIIRKATEEDLEKSELNDQRTKEAYKFCLEKIEERKLPMKLFQVIINLDNTKSKFYFSAEGRVDFRELIKDLAKKLRMKIEMRQIGVRDEAKLLGGCGPCGQKLCCARFLKDFEPVSIKMAKNQNLPLNPLKITGKCGRLLCCLIYENDTYKGLRKNIPKAGTAVKTPEGEGKIVGIDIIQQKVTIQMEDGERGIFSVNQIERIK